MRTLRHHTLALVESAWFKRSILVLIILNAILLGLETSPTYMHRFGAFLTHADKMILGIFIVEIALRFFAYGWRFFTRAWNLFDVVVVLIALAPAAEAFSALRTLRVLRVLRIVSTIPSMRRVVEGLLSAIPGILSVVCILLIIFYIFAVIGTNLYGITHPQWFGSIGKTMFSLFQIMTLESWAMGIVRPLMETHPHAWIFFVLYILIAAFTMFNLFVAIIVNSLQSESDEEARQQRMEIAHEIERMVRNSEARLTTLIESQLNQPPSSQAKKNKEG